MEVPEPGAERSAPDLAGLVSSASRGDQRAWRHLVDSYGPRVFALARSRLRDVELAEEVTQSVFATVATKLGQGQYAEHGRFEPWLFRIAMNRVRDTVRQAKRERDSERLRLAATPATVEADTSAPEIDMTALRRVLGELSAADRDIIELRYHAGLSFRQMTELLDEPLGTLLARHHRALKKLKRLLESDEETPEHAGVRQFRTSEGTA